ncbi:DAK2 domain-containing protein [Escherichia coli]
MVEKLPAIADKDIGFILKNTGMTLLSSVGGASGPLFGTFFIRAAQATQARQSRHWKSFISVPRWRGRRISCGKPNLAIKPCVMCGRRWWNRYVSPASKSLVPVVLEAASRIAESAAQSTITMQARKGRASHPGERSIGHQHPGATSVMFMMQMLVLAAKE